MPERTMWKAILEALASILPVFGRTLEMVLYTLIDLVDAKCRLISVTELHLSTIPLSLNN